MTSVSPPGWKSVALDAVCEIIQGQSPPGDTYNVTGEGLPFFQGKAEFGDMVPVVQKWCTSPTKIAQPGDVLISIRAPVGPTNLAPSACCIGRGLAAIRPEGGIPSRYLLYAIRSTVDELTAKETGSTFGAISGEQLRSHEVALAPLAEQHRIVDEIEKQLTRLDAAVAALERARANLKRYRASVLKAAVEGQLLKESPKKHDSDQELKMPVPRKNKWRAGEAFSWSLPFAVPAHWRTAFFGNILDIEGGSQPPKSHFAFEPVEGYVRLLQIRDFGEKPVPTYVPRNEVSKFCNKDDVFVARYGASLGRILTGMEGAYNVALAKVINVHKVFTTEFLFYLLQTQVFQRPIHMISRSAQNGFNKGEVFPIELPVPPREEQARIVSEIERRVSVVDVMEVAVDHGLIRAERLRQSVLKRAFEGRLVPQDPDDEPASVLLERIRAERAKTEATPRRGRKTGRQLELREATT